MPYALPLGLLTGLLLGAVGGGGSVLTIPMLVYVLDLDVHEATGTALVIVGANAAVGVTAHGRNGAVRWREGVLFGALGISGAVAGSQLNPAVPDAVILGGLAVLMFVAAAQMWRGAAPAARPGRPEARPWPTVAATGIGVGVLTGFFGVGGGFIIVPALVLVLGLAMSDAVGTSLLVILFNSAAGSVSFLASGEIALDIAALFIVGGTLGTVAGARIARRADDARLREAFAVLLIGVALLLTFREGAGALA